MMMTATQARWLALIEEAARCAATPRRPGGALKVLAVGCLDSWGPGEDDRHPDNSGEWLARAFVQLAGGYAEAASIVRRAALAPALAALAAELMAMMPAASVPVFPTEGPRAEGGAP